MKKFAVVGNPIAHSLSPVIHQEFAEQFDLPISYERIQAELHDFENCVRKFFMQGGTGLNITAPFKERAFLMSERPTERAMQAGAVNTFWVDKGKLYADNTDGVGLIRDLQHYKQINQSRILLLGAGGAARGVLSSLVAEKPQNLVIVNRTLEKAQSLKNSFSEIVISTYEDLKGPFDIIIHATSCRVIDSLRLPQYIWQNAPFCYDLLYHKNGQTAFVKIAHEHGCEGVDGLGMLMEQAAEAFYIWHGVRPIVSKARIVKNYLS